MTDIQTNFLALEEPLIERVRVRVPALVRIGAGGDLQSANAVRGKMPAAFILWRGNQVQPSRGGESVAQTLYQIWSIILLITLATVDGGAARRVAGELISQVDAALHGWRSEVDGVGALERVGGDPPFYNFQEKTMAVDQRYQARVSLRARPA